MENFHPTITVHDAASAPLASLAESIGEPTAITGHSHCWHDTMHVLTSLPPQHIEICCHCGAERNVPERVAFGQAAGHGPHAPSLRVDWARPGSDESVLVVGTLEETDEAPAPAAALSDHVCCWHAEDLRDICQAASDTLTVIEDWLGQASTREAARDSMWRLHRMLEQAGIQSTSQTALDWRGSLVKELNDAGFFNSPEGFRYDPAAAVEQPRRIYGNARGPLLKEFVEQATLFTPTLPLAVR